MSEFAKEMRGYVTDSLFHWGRQKFPVRTFARIETGYYKTASTALKSHVSRYPSDNVPVLDEVYIRLEAPLKAVMRTEYRDCVDGTAEEKAYRCGVSRRTYFRRRNLVIAAAEAELLTVADKNQSVTLP